MKIDSAVVGMESARSYKAVSYSMRRYALTDFASVLTGGGAGTQETNAGEKGKGEEDAKLDELSNSKSWTVDGIMDLQQKMSAVRRNYSVRQREDIQAETIRQQSVLYIFELLFGKFKDRFGSHGKHAGMQGNGSKYTPNEDISNLQQSNQFVQRINISMLQTIDYYQENEATAFSTTGTVKTKDGREISFNVDVLMSRSFTSEFAKQMDFSAAAVCDPLVINLDGDIAEVSDQKIRFDIDADGEIDEISKLSSGSGYLSLDKNGNGQIDDGSELFGTKSGDGFRDLSEYDDDMNGWIDEGDEIWNKLKIWVTDESGSEHLYSLAEAGVGAICLKNASTEFAQKASDNSDKAFVRSTGIFLYENGNVGTLQHLDMVKYQKEA